MGGLPRRPGREGAGERLEGPHAGATAPWKEIYRGYVEAGFPSGAPVPGLD
uniref:Uncharacterized protein n=1 Tax=Streptomyces avermitilis TaxID=33903 RepID=A0A499W6R0_STRAX|nr:hypothetical protein SAVMC3_84850 [Streptomyces avermitilis]